MEKGMKERIKKQTKAFYSSRSKSNMWNWKKMKRRRK